MARAGIVALLVWGGVQAAMGFVAPARRGALRMDTLNGAGAGVTHEFNIPAGPSRVTFGLDEATFTEMASALNGVLLDFRGMKEAAAKGARHPAKLMSLDTSVADTGVQLELECNPNGFPDQFSAEVFVVVKAGGLRVATDVPLTQLVEAMKVFKAANLATAKA